MHRSFSPRCDKAVPRNPSLRQPALSGRARIWQWASALAAGMAVAACGGGGGGGDAPSTTNTPPGSTVSSSAAPFPIGMSMASPTALAASSSVIAGGLGIVNLGFNTSATTTQSVLSSQVDALATGRLTLAASGLLSTAALFDTSPRPQAACQGPAVAYQNHDDATGSQGVLARGAVAMWTDTETGQPGLPCGVATLLAQTGGLSQQAHQAMLLMAALRHAVIVGSIAMPAGGQTLDLTARADALLASLLGGATLQSASVALNSDGNEFIYRLVLATGSGASAQTLEITLLHTPAETDTRYAGVLQLAQSYLSTDAAIGCGDRVDGAGRFQVARMTTVGYNRQDQWLSLRARSGQYCGHAADPQASHAAQIASLVTSGELNPAVYLSGGIRGVTKGWRQGFLRMGTDLVMSSQTSDFVYAWQDMPQNGTGHARLMAGRLSLDDATRTRTLRLYQGHTDDITVTDGTLRGLICNTSGPGATATMQALFQSQTLTLAPSATTWSLTASQVGHAPTNTCSASAGMAFDANGDGVLGAGEGAGFTHQLAAPTAGRTEVQDELIEEGFLTPILML